ncbi:HTH-type transcriptional repressor PurR [Arenibacter antarcticus]|uniref:Substrate-binding domain-containing protein n=1 Tax=Arenibacter antarcticus TaxID=2040469 RepID=A0ABW5VDE0_9FLAO|nr:substrate-binding domain-containing protein [Arenibacter sp. H213]MCM4168305.1 LacI family transcriptional regulator [Arenibacter sp. H213]
MIKKKYTIKDIAQMAGVSKGTVDRVLHNRGKVSKDAFEKVDSILKNIDFKPNLHARNLKNNKIYSIAVLLPDPNIESFWNSANKGITAASNEFNPFGIQVKKYFYDPIDKFSFVEQSQKAIKSGPNVLIMVPTFLKESEEVLRICKNTNIFTILFNNQLNTLTDYVFIGQDLNQSGRVAANLMNRIIKENDTIAIVHINKEPHMEQKENGFKNYFKEHSGSKHVITTQTFKSNNELVFSKAVALFLKENPKTSAFYITNSKAYLFLNILQDLNKKDITIIGYDVLKENIKYLKEGKIDFLIHQKPYKQAYLCVANIAKHFLFGKNLPTLKFLPIDIITSENAHYHL